MLTLAPSRSTCPTDGSISVVIIETVVDLPEPFGPSRPSTPPRSSRKFTSLTAGMPA